MSDIVNKIKSMTLASQITDLFTEGTAAELRRWYVDTFVFDGRNADILPTLRSSTLERLFETREWPSVEHAAIGSRLLFAMKPDTVVRAPNLMEPDMWSTEDEIALTMMRLFEPWKSVRYDPNGEVWFTSAIPGQWIRHGKGAPSNNEIEARIFKWLSLMDPNERENLDRYAAWPPDVTNMQQDQVLARQGGVMSRFKKFRGGPATKLAAIRKSFERTQIMYLDTATLNQVKTIYPFGNGALSLVDFSFVDTAGEEQHIHKGQLLPMDLEYMVMNANNLPWRDPKGEIASVVRDLDIADGQWDLRLLEDIQDKIMIDHCPTYHSFILHAFPEPDERGAFLRLLGCTMYGTNLKVVAALIGEPNAGKDTAINWLNYLMPGQVASLPFSAFTAYGNPDQGFATLMGARVATVSGEVGEGKGSKLLAERLKTVSSGGGKIRVSEKYEKPSDIWFDGALYLQGNTVPAIAGGDKGLYQNRLVAVPFVHPFPLREGAFETAYRTEASWFAQVLFLNYIVYKLKGGGMQGINPPESWKVFAKEFADTSNSLGWLEACVVPSDSPIPTTEFHSALTELVSRYGNSFDVSTHFWPKRLRRLGFQMKGPASCRKQGTHNGKPGVWRYNLGIDASKSDGVFTQEDWELALKNAAVTSR